MDERLGFSRVHIKRGRDLSFNLVYFYLFSLSWRGMRPEQRFWCGLTKLAGIREMSENWTKPMVDRPYQEILMPDTHKNGASHYRNLINLMYPT